jgi:hypothetical protein
MQLHINSVYAARDTTGRPEHGRQCSVAMQAFDTVHAGKRDAENQQASEHAAAVV